MITCDWSSDVCSSDLPPLQIAVIATGFEGVLPQT
jgi:hypothetical protein